MKVLNAFLQQSLVKELEHSANQGDKQTLVVYYQAMKNSKKHSFYIEAAGFTLKLIFHVPDQHSNIRLPFPHFDRTPNSWVCTAVDAPAFIEFWLDKIHGR